MSIKNNIQRIKLTIPEGVKYVVVSKYRPIEQLQQAYDAGMRIFAENRPAELAAKVEALPKDIQWHFIGHLQTNKLKMVLPYCSLIQSVDSIHLMEAMERFCSQHSLNANILVEVHIGAEVTKQGFSPEETVELFSKRCHETFPHLTFCGLMGMASHTDDPVRIEEDFALIKQIFDTIRELHPELTSFTELSIGMSHDYMLALKHGATMVRIGSMTFE